MKNRIIKSNKRIKEEEKLLYDLLLKGGWIIDPSQNIDFIADLAIEGNKISKLSKFISQDKAKRTINVKDKLVIPGLIDFHTHIYWGGTLNSVKPDSISVRTGVTTMIDAGSAGAGNIENFKTHIIEKSKCNILPFLNVAYSGMCGTAAKLNVPGICDLRILDYSEAVNAVRKFDKLICGIKVVCFTGGGGAGFGIEPIRIAKAVAKEINKPLMVHIGKRAIPVTSRRTMQEGLDLLKKGDILTHCFAGSNSIFSQDNKLLTEVLDARKRGVIFDIGHGSGGLSFNIARKAFNLKFLPDIISSDLHARCIDGPVYDLLTTMSKFVNLGMSINNVIRAVTYEPARVLGRDGEIGTLKTGSYADVAVLELEKSEFKFEDSEGEIIIGNQRFVNNRTIIRGEVLN